MKINQFLLSLFVSFLMLLSACTSPVVEPLPQRVPAESDSLFDEVFTIAKSNQPSVAGEDLKTKAKDHLQIRMGYTTAERRVDFVSTSALSEDAPFKIELDIDRAKNLYVIRVFHHPKAFKDKLATYSMLNFTQSIIEGQNLSQAQSYFEMFYNARGGDPVALKNFLAIKDNPSSYVNEEFAQLSTSQEFTERQKHNTQIAQEIDKEIKELKSWQKKQTEKRKAPLAALDKAAEDKQFRALVAKNDRKGAAKILRTYLPWETMAPFEKQFWETYLEVMANPVPLEERVYIYRGLEEDFIHSGYKNGVALAQKEAIMDQNAFVMSTLMVKNQGSWNRRLRSLEAMTSKEIATLGGETKYAQSARITTMFYNHASDPMGSPFLSFSPNYNVASNFGGERVSSYLIDPRLLHFNYASSIQSEIEYLLPLTTFPEDLVAICDSKLHGFGSYSDPTRKDFLDKKLAEKIEAKYGKTKTSAIVTKIQKNSYEFFHEKFKVMPQVSGPHPGVSNKKFYKSLGAEAFKPDLGPKGELQCRDIIHLFWVNN